jgi:hypothetical protein
MKKHYTPEEKVATLRHPLEKEPISKLCDEVGLQPTAFYRWQKEFFEKPLDVQIADLLLVLVQCELSWPKTAKASTSGLCRTIQELSGRKRVSQD